MPSLERSRLDRTGRGLGLLAAAAAAASAVVLTSCASIPTSGPVRQGGGGAGTVNTNQVVGVIAQPPRPGMTQQEVVEGFLLAAAAFDNDHAVARSYLTSAAQGTWNPSAGVTVYDNAGGPEATLVRAGLLTFVAPRIGMISNQGKETAASGTVTARFTVRKVAGQWRIASLPNGLLLTQNDVNRGFQPFDLYFPVPDPSSTVLVPDQVLVPRGSGQSTALVEALLSGPTPWLAPAVRTAFPPGTKLAVNSAPIENGTVTVDLTAPAGSVAGKQLDAMTAQLVWTLSQLNVNNVRILVEGSGERVVNVEDPRFGKWNPDGASLQSTAYFVRDGRLVSIQPGHIAPVQGPAGDGTVKLASPGVSYDQTQVAGLEAGGTELVAAKIGKSESAVVVRHGVSFTPPSWDLFGVAWFVDRRPNGPHRWNNVFWSYSVSHGLKPVMVQGLPAGEVLNLRISPDGARAVVLMATATGNQVYLARVIRADGALVSGFAVVNAKVSNIQGVSWSSADNLLVLGSATPGGTAPPDEPSVISLNGAEVQLLVSIPASSGATTGIAQVSQAPSQPVVASTTDGRVWLYAGFQWQLVGKGSYAIYPG